MPNDLSDPNLLSLAFAEELYEQYATNPQSVSDDWRRYFASIENGHAGRPARLGPSFGASPLFRELRNGTAAPYAAAPAPIEMEGPIKTVPHDIAMVIRQDWADQLVRAYRSLGHYHAQLDPLGRPRPKKEELDPTYYGLNEADWTREFSTDTIAGSGGPQMMTLREIVDRLKTTYCRSIGVEYMHIDDTRIRRWLTERMESTQNRLSLSRAEQMRIYTKLTDAVAFEEFLSKKFPGKKTFSLKGGETLIPMLDLAVEHAATHGVEQVMFAMAHRGRLNVLANVIGKNPQWIFRELDDPEADIEKYRGRGDVKYHLGFSRDVQTSTGRKVHISLCFNPSHLEFVNPVALGRVRAMQDRYNDPKGERELPILIHGDAAFIGEGIIQETFNLSGLPGYQTGGTVHVIVNNQIGFTTAPEGQGRSTTYTTDIAKMLPIPIFHVNGEDPEATAQVVRLALDFRKEFHRDVVIDLYCYRYYGHNETDEPAFTQPLMYRKIRSMASVRDSYLAHLVGAGGINQADADRIKEERQAKLEAEIAAARAPGFKHVDDEDRRLRSIWKGYRGGDDANCPEVSTAVAIDRLKELATKLTTTPPEFKPHKTIERVLEGRRKMGRGEAPLDWAMAEALAFASIATEPGRPGRIRMSGQDVERGTFSHRHAVLHDFETGKRYSPLQHVAPNQAPVEIFNSPLSEAAVLGYEWGYSLKTPEGLTLWEAQFGDFVNCAQVIIDQFISSAEDKWKLLSGLVMLLPHGFEGAGPEHSSARLERFLSAGAEDNIQVVNLTTPGQYFHCLRRQAMRAYRKPLIVMTPKSLLRDEMSTSKLEDFAGGGFERVMADPLVAPGAGVRRILLCSGKVYFDLERFRRENDRRDVAIIRLEQLFPLPHEQLKATLAPYPAGTPAFWVQEEPKNMGAWYFLNTHLSSRLVHKHPLLDICRPESASPATGSTSSHKQEQKELVHAAFAIG
ncbi:MAG TPA: 2-oxoglutarate dehydrogenase E1 component [Planctomycetia bacterium]|nr:2-oxoglutarate dehydrogenase E1 component [Planctomycetia bacterium]